MLAIIGGLGAASAFAVATLCSARSTRMIGPSSVLAWVMLVDLGVTGPLALHDGIAISAVLASQFGALAGVMAYLLFRERLARVQVAGVATIVVGVGILSALRA